MTTAIRILGLDRDKWARVGPHTLWSATGLAVTASVLMALNRFGGALIDAPRAFLRLALVGIWGWLGLAFGIWVFAELLAFGPEPRTARSPGPSFQHTLAVVGVAHTPMMLLGLVILVSAGMLQTLGPGLWVAVFVFGFWFPAALAVSIRHARQVSLVRGISVVAVPYVVWFLVIGRHLLGQVQHLL